MKNVKKALWRPFGFTCMEGHRDLFIPVHPY
jgi:hypothetical protein